MRRSIVAGNWKMNTTLSEALALVDALRPQLGKLDGVDCVVCPPFISLAAVSERLSGSSIIVGAQNMWVERSGAYTGEISPLMLEGLVTFVIIGHSERRQYFAESDELVNRKARLALDQGLTPIICVGESLGQREANETEAVLERQVRGALAEIDDPKGLVIAYEPIWAIGTGRAATPDLAGSAIGLLRRSAGNVRGSPAASALRIQYGGSVTPDNFADYIAQPEIDGALVGGASLKAEPFAEICRQAQRAKR
jgi:triosephosphate isomerase